MHFTAREYGRMFFENYWKDDFISILDVGALDVNGTLRDIAPASAAYTGIDLEAGNGVDRVLDDPYEYPFPDNSFDAVISTSCFEHDIMFWLTILECSRVVSDRGFIYVNAPSSGPYHAYPYDHWQFYPDAGVALEMWCERMNRPLKCVETFISDQLVGAFNDCVMIFTRDDSNIPKRYISDVTPRAFNVRKGSLGEITKRIISPRAK